MTAILSTSKLPVLTQVWIFSGKAAGFPSWEGQGWVLDAGALAPPSATHPYPSQEGN